MLPNYPPPTVAAFNWTGQTGLNAGTSSSSVALPASPDNAPPNTTVIITNSGTEMAFVNLGDAEVSVSTSDGFPCPPNVLVALALNGATHLAGIVGSGTAQLGVSVGR